MLGPFCVMYIFASSLRHMAVMRKSFVQKRGGFSSKELLNFTQCDNYLLPNGLCMGKVHTKGG